MTSCVDHQARVKHRLQRYVKKLYNTARDTSKHSEPTKQLILLTTLLALLPGGATISVKEEFTATLGSGDGQRGSQEHLSRAKFI